MHGKARVLFFILAALVCCLRPVSAESPDEDIFRGELLTKKLQKRPEEPLEIRLKEKLEAEKPKPALPGELVFILQINVVGATALPQEKINRITRPYKNKKLSGLEMQRCADELTLAYSNSGYITSYAYISSGKINQGTLDITVLEGRVGKIEIKGNRYFSERLIRKKMRLKEGGLFNIAHLKTDLYRINYYQDRKADVAVEMAKERGYVDIILNVRDKSPIHLTLEADNYEAQYVLYNRYKALITHNNLTGRDDALALKFQVTEADSQRLIDLDYLIPFNKVWEFEFYAMPYKPEDYYGDREDADMQKRTKKAFIYFYQSLIDEPGCELWLAYGFVYKDAVWYERGGRIHEDRFRAGLFGFDANIADRFGRTVVIDELEMGIPGMWGGSAAKDTACSVRGAGGDYKVNHFIIARKHALFGGVDFVGKAHWQLSSQTLTGANAFSVGGFMGSIDNRGYPKTQTSGDNGQAVDAGFSFPAYLVPRGVKAPFSQAKLYDALKLFVFFDWARAVFKSPVAGQKRNNTLRSAGCGFTFTLPENLSARVDFGWPLGVYPKDGDGFHTWFRVTKGF